MTPALELRLLKAAIGVAGLVPVGAGLSGALLGARFVEAGPVGADLDSHVRYLSGLLLGLGLAFWWAMPTIERRGGLVRLLTAIVFLGGMARLLGVLVAGVPGPPMLFGLAMELVVTPALWLWRERVVRRLGVPARGS